MAYDLFTFEQHNEQASEEKVPSLLVVDSFALLFRGFFSTAVTGNYMRNSRGICTNGLYQFTRYLMDAIRTYQPTHVICAFDMGAQTFRNTLYPAYKAQRDKPPEELIPQFDLLWELVESYNMPCIGVPGYEADDVIGSIAARHSQQQHHVNILTGDGDALQLINSHTEVTLMKKGFGNYLTVNMHNFQAEKGIAQPQQIIEMKALMGDASDNIPGCPKVGPKTALKLIQEFGTVDNVFANLTQINGKLRDRLDEHRELIMLSRDLATIRTDVPYECSLQQSAYRLNADAVREKFRELEFGERLLRQMVDLSAG